MPNALLLSTVTAFALQLGVQLASGSPFIFNPYTPVGKTVALDANHPAFGAQVPEGSVSYRAMARSLPDSLADLLVTAAENAAPSEGGAPREINSTARTNDQEGSVGVVVAAKSENLTIGEVGARQLEVATSEDLARLESFFGRQMVYVFDKLPRKGSINPVPWPSSYWPDQYGRFKDITRRDIGAGFFHIAVTNMLGLLRHSFIVDVTAGAEVWNQPVRSYEVLEAAAIDPAQAGRKYFRTNSYPFNPSAAKLVFVKTRFKWIVEASEDGPLVSTGKVEKSTKSADYTYILELDRSGNIIGGEWVDKSQENHPDFLWFPTAKPALNTVTEVGLKYSEVAGLLASSISGWC
ncbi:hypothetical protein PybrP1_004279 [[Pythium] brassicae (nom. inval.)]|nr:hypothetical protein PybrP1_004279 [[Pythium] brassicae (nom. inval.)]